MPATKSKDLLFTLTEESTRKISLSISTNFSHTDHARFRALMTEPKVNLKRKKKPEKELVCKEYFNYSFMIRKGKAANKLVIKRRKVVQWYASYLCKYRRTRYDGWQITDRHNLPSSYRPQFLNMIKEYREEEEISKTKTTRTTIQMNRVFMPEDPVIPDLLKKMPELSVKNWLKEYGIDLDSAPARRLLRTIDGVVKSEVTNSGNIVWRIGQQLGEAYRKCEGSTSCMTGVTRKHLIQLYVLNPKFVRLAILMIGKRIHARCLVWTIKENGKLVWYPDKVYPATHSRLRKIYNSLEIEAKKKKATIRWMYNYDLEYINTTPFWLVLKVPDDRSLPYMDTMLHAKLLIDGTVQVASKGNEDNDDEDGDRRTLANPPRLPKGVKSVYNEWRYLDSIHGGPYRVKYVLCRECGIHYNPIPMDMLTSDNRFYRARHALFMFCSKCWDKKVVDVLCGKDHRPCYKRKDKCVYSKNLKEWIDPNASWTKMYLEEHDSDWRMRDPSTINKSPPKGPPLYRTRMSNGGRLIVELVEE